MNVRCVLFCASMTLVAALPATARGEADDGPVDRAERAYAGLDYHRARDASLAALQRRGLSHDQLVRLQRVLVLASAAIGEESAARDAAVTLLMMEPTFSVDSSLSPRLRAPLDEARLYWRDRAVVPGLRAQSSPLETEAPGVLRITLTDPLRVARSVVVGVRWGELGEFTVHERAASASIHVPLSSPPPGTRRLDYYAVALDGRGSAIFALGSEDAPEARLVAARPREEARESTSVWSSGWFWAGAAVVAGGAAAATLAATTPWQSGAAAPFTPTLSCGGGGC